jgi:hypothetical protein
MSLTYIALGTLGFTTHIIKLIIAFVVGVGLGYGLLMVHALLMKKPQQ